jgi:hypothetical protein
MYMEKQVYYLSIIGVFTSLLFGMGLLFLIPTLTQIINIKTNYVSYNKVIISSSLFYCFSGLVLNVVCLLFYFILVPSL